MRKVAIAVALVLALAGCTTEGSGFWAPGKGVTVSDKHDYTHGELDPKNNNALWLCTKKGIIRKCDEVSKTTYDAYQVGDAWEGTK